MFWLCGSIVANLTIYRHVPSPSQFETRQCGSIVANPIIYRLVPSPSWFENKQWYPDQSDWLNGAWNMMENAQKFEWKTPSKISCHYTWLLHGKNCLSLWCFLGSVWIGSKPSRRTINAEKNTKRRKRKGKEKFKSQKPKDEGHFRFWFLHMPELKCRKLQC